MQVCFQNVYFLSGGGGGGGQSCGAPTCANERWEFLCHDILIWNVSKSYSYFMYISVGTVPRALYTKSESLAPEINSL